MEPKETGKAIDNIIDEMIDVVDNSKSEIIDICEEARQEHVRLEAELSDTKEKVIQHIKDGDKLEKAVKHSRRRLSVVSKYFDRYTEKDIREVYEKTHIMQTELAILQQEEAALRKRRDELERRLLVLIQMIDRAEGLANKISVVLPYLHDDFRQVNEMIKDAKQKHEFGLKIIVAQEAERRRISREIHDGPAQMMANILLRSELIERALREQSVAHALTEIRSTRKMMKSSLHEVRRIIYDLRPMALDDLGLIPTVKKYIENTADYNNIKMEFVLFGEEKRVEQEYEITLFRLIQESLQNAIKHGEATIITVKLEISKKNLSLAITDNGTGFDPNEKKDESFGLIGMKERVEMLEGKFMINSGNNIGTRIFVNIPYHG